MKEKIRTGEEVIALLNQKRLKGRGNRLWYVLRKLLRRLGI